MILGDPNAHDSSWYEPQDTDQRGTDYIDQLSHFNILNDINTPTRKPHNINNSATSPDISLATFDIASRCEWKTLHEMSSDHLPILISYTLHKPHILKQKRTFTNYRLADWEEFTSETEHLLDNFQLTDYNNIDTAVKHFNTIVTNASKHHIPTGSVKHYKPFYTRSVKQKIQQRKHLRSQTPTSDILARIQQLNKEIDEDIEQDIKTRWQKALSELDFRTIPTRL